MAEIKPLIVNAPPLPVVQFNPGTSTGSSTSNSSSSSKSGFDLGGLFTGLFGTVDKYLEYQTARVNNSGGGQIVYQPAGGTPAVTGGGGFDLSNPIVLIALAGGVYLLTKGSDKK